jgi:AcrR family transcriptional regulator
VTTSETRPQRAPTKVTRRRRGEPRRLLLEAARELFAQQGFTATSARDIADRAGVSEPLLYRNFGSKVGLFRDALVVPFLELVAEVERTRETSALATLDGDAAGRAFLGDLFDRFQDNRGIVLTLWGAEAGTVPELVDSGVADEITEGLRRLVDVGTGDVGAGDGASGRRRSPSDDELRGRTVVAMVAGAALFGQSAFLGRRAPSRDELVDEMVRTILHGRRERRRS